VPAPPQQRESGPQRIAKLLARAGIASRREIEQMIAEGRIALNGEKITTPATLLEDVAGLTLDGRPVRPAKATRLYRFYKPPGTLTAERDPRGRATIYDRLPPGLPRLMPVGRLDYMTEGLLLLTNDGELKRQLELPRTGVVRTYRARAFGDVCQATLEGLADGITVDGMHYGSIDANLERRTGRNCWIELSLTEGKNREVRRVLAHLGLQVSRLIRTAYGPFTLADLEPGGVGEVAPDELDDFRRSLG
jgi:23S rRNA pseudouridine2605 synthase